MTTLLEEYYKTWNRLREEFTDNNIILLMQVGSFYEAYEYGEEGCAKKVSDSLRIILTKRNTKQELSADNPYLCGIPIYTLYRHISRLNDDGYTVAVYDQEEGDKKKRYRKAVYSPILRGEYEDETSEETKDEYLYSIMTEEYVYRDRKEGMINRVISSYCRINIKTGKIIFGESDSSSIQEAFHKFYLENKPKRVILFMGNENAWISKQYPYIEIIEGTNRQITENEQICIFQTAFNFHAREYLQFMERHGFHRYPFAMECITKTLRYIKQYDPLLITHLEVPCINDEHKKKMDYNYDLLHELNIFHSTREKGYGRREMDKKEKTIFSILSRDMNAMAKRYFFEILRNPCKEINELKERRKNLEIFSKMEGLEIKQKNIMDMEILFLKWKRNRLSYSKIVLLLENYSQCYKKTFEHEKKIEEGIKEFNQNWNFEKGNIPNAVLMTDRMKELEEEREKICKDANNIIKNKFIKTWNIEEDIAHPISLGIKKWNQNKAELITCGYYEISKTTNTIKISHQYLDSLYMRWKQIDEQIHELGKKEFQEYCLNWFSKYALYFEMFHSWYSKYMCWYSLYKYFKNHNYINPILEDDTTSSFIEFKELRHPIIEVINNDELFVPISGSIGLNNTGIVLYGINGAGKSTLLRTVGCSLWLAQCGLYVPCTLYFRFNPFHSVYSKINIQDNIYIGHSTFVAEMYELKYILERSNKDTLVLCDELTSGTESQSATALVISTLIEFIEKKTKFIITTHLHNIVSNSRLQIHKKCIDVLHFEMELENEKLYIPNIEHRYNRRLLEGSGKSLYGIEIAKQIGLPESFIRRAFEIREQEPQKSKYNRRLVKTECFICKSKEELHTHHITPQIRFETDIALKACNKNGLYNLVVLCKNCHEQLHKVSED